MKYVFYLVAAVSLAGCITYINDPYYPRPLNDPQGIKEKMQLSIDFRPRVYNAGDSVTLSLSLKNLSNDTLTIESLSTICLWHWDPKTFTSYESIESEWYQVDTLREDIVVMPKAIHTVSYAFDTKSPFFAYNPIDSIYAQVRHFPLIDFEQEKTLYRPKSVYSITSNKLEIQTHEWKEKVFGEMTDSIGRWVQRIAKQENVPSDIVALNFGMFESIGGHCYCLYLIGSRQYDANNDDWAGFKHFEPDDKYLIIPYMYSFAPSHEQFQNDVVRILKECMSNADVSRLFDGRVVTAGFDDGNLVRIK